MTDIVDKILNKSYIQNQYQKQKLSDKIFDNMMENDEKIFDKTYDFIQILLEKEKKGTALTINIVKEYMIKAHEIDDLLFTRCELSSAHSVVDNMEKEND